MRILILITILFLLNIIGQTIFFRIDLTQDKRYSLSPVANKILAELEDDIFIRVYLEGDFPAGFVRLQKSIRETLEEFRNISGNKIQYQFINPNENKEEKERRQLYLQLAKKGLQPTNLNFMQDGKKSELIIFPGALVCLGEKEIPALFLKGNSSSSPEEILNQSVEGVEFELLSAIRKITVKQKKKIRFLQGHGELNTKEITDLARSLSEYYDVDTMRLWELNDTTRMDALVIANPQHPFTEWEKYKIDQFVMRGGKLVLSINKININIDSIGPQGIMAMPTDYNLDDLLFQYGIRLNSDLIQDIYSGFIPMVTGYIGNQTQKQMVNWNFYPVANIFSEHPVTRNLDAIYLKFVGSMDTVFTEGVKKIPLVFTSRNCKLMKSPVRVSFDDLKLEIDPSSFRKGPVPVVYLLEGTFTSVFNNRLKPETKTTFKFLSKSNFNKIVVISDGDLMRNDVLTSNGEIFPLGYDRFTRKTFGNKELCLHLLDYLLDDKGIISVRGKKVILRPLDKLKINKYRKIIQTLNLILPVMLILSVGIVFSYRRRKKFVTTHPPAIFCHQNTNNTK